MSKDKQPKDPAEQGNEIKTAADLIQDENNYRKHSDTNKARIKKSIDEAGLGRSVVIDADGVLVAGNGVQSVIDKDTPVRVVETDGTELVVVKRTDLHTGDPRRKTLALADNATADDVEWDFDAIAEDWTEDEAGEWGVDWPADEENETYEETIKRKEAEFKQRMEAGEDLSEDEEYLEFLDKFKAKKTTDDCYTPAVIYEAVAKWVENEYHVIRKDFVRPFYPGGDYKAEKYPKGCIVVDNPPFSILAEIQRFYVENGIKFFIFAPSLTLFGSQQAGTTALPIDVTCTYDNGANVNASFITNLEDPVIRFRSVPELYAAVKAANDENLKQLKKQVPKYSYPPHIVTAAFMGSLSKYGIPFSVRFDESEKISQLDSQKESGKAIYGSGFIISDSKAAEKAAAEKAAAEKAAAEKAAAEKAAAEKAAATRWTLSDRERAIIAKLSLND